jgi:superfamily I DNA/RNA helicase
MALAPEAPPEITLFGDDLPQVAGRIDAIFDYFRGDVFGGVKPGAEFLQALVDMLAPTFELRAPLGPALARDDRELLRLTEAQFNVLDMLARQRRVAVSGGAGTGKTVLALEKARRLAAEGLEVLLTCFNRPLAEFLRRSAGDVPRLAIANFHQFCWQAAQDAHVPLPEQDAPEARTPGFFNVALPDALLAALDRLPRRFDAIVVDEGQDFLEGWWAPLQLCLADPDGGILYVFHDDNQQVYRRVSSFPVGMSEIVLCDTLRNTQRIHAATTRFYRGEPLRAKGPEGREIECACAETQSAAVHAVSRILHRLVREEGVPPGDVAVLYGSSANGPLKRGERIGSFWTTTDQYVEPGKVLLDSIRRFKGLERRVILLVGIDDLAPEDEQALLYVGLSRARTYLAVVARQATLGRLGFGGE